MILNDQTLKGSFITWIKVRTSSEFLLSLVRSRVLDLSIALAKVTTTGNKESPCFRQKSMLHNASNIKGFVFCDYPLE